MQGSLAHTYAEASGFLVDAVGRVPADAWDRPGLGTWTVRELVGHANRAHTLVRDYVLDPQPPEPPDGEYFTPVAIEARGRDAVRALGDDPLGAVTASAHATAELIATTPADATLGSPVGTMTLADYLPSRIAELVIHGLDLLDALALLDGLDIDTDLAGGDSSRPAPPPDALRVALAFVADRAAGRQGDVVLRALTGRASLPDGYSVY